MTPARDTTTFQMVDDLGMSGLGDLLGTGACKRKVLDRDAALPGKVPSTLLGTLLHWVLVLPSTLDEGEVGQNERAG